MRPSHARLTAHAAQLVRNYRGVNPVSATPDAELKHNLTNAAAVALAGFGISKIPTSFADTLAEAIDLAFNGSIGHSPRSAAADVVDADYREIPVERKR